VLNALTSLRQKMMPSEATIYFHSPCFDGMISCVLAWEFLETEERWSIRHIRPVNYDLRANWLEIDLDTPCAVLDFLYHPSARFWADHHSTTFASEKAQDYYHRRASASSLLVYDPHSSSTASLLWNRFSSFFVNRPRLQEMMQWADKIDSARYESVEEAIVGDAPALRINFSLMLGDADYCESLVRRLRENDLKFVSELPDVMQRFEKVRKKVLRGLDHLRQRIVLLNDGITAFDVETTDDVIVSRYSPFHFFPNARYSIGILRHFDAVRVTAMRNPWLTFESVALGRIFERFGGGGHQRVGSVRLSGQRATSAEQIADEILHEMRDAESQSELPIEAAIA
jgi:hypothetical protein